VPALRTRQRTSDRCHGPDGMSVIADLPGQADAKESPRAGDEEARRRHPGTESTVAPTLAPSSAGTGYVNTTPVRSRRTPINWLLASPIDSAEGQGLSGDQESDKHPIVRVGVRSDIGKEFPVECTEPGSPHRGNPGQPSAGPRIDLPATADPISDAACSTELLRDVGGQVGTAAVRASARAAAEAPSHDCLEIVPVERRGWNGSSVAKNSL
jgi:hypothetical protein